MDQIFFNIDWEGIIPSFVGGLIAGACMLAAVFVQHKIDMEREVQKDAILINGFVHSILTEIQTLWGTYQETLGKKLEALERGKPFLNFYPITEDYFSVYNSNAFLVGRIRDPKLRQLIVETYTKARGLIDGYRLNNDMVQKYRHLDLMRQDLGSSNLANMMWLQEQELINYVPRLREQHQQTKTSIDHLLLIVRKEKTAAQGE